MDTKNQEPKSNFPPVLSVLGHVDHGKTSLLDSIRKTGIAKREHGGITQKIGASQIEITHEKKLRKITFIDTPGHEAFSNMRSQGVNAADIALLVIAADDGIKPQTKESIDKIKEAGIPYIVVFTKIDLETANIERVKKEVITGGILLEGLGGNVPYIGVSATTREKISDLLDLILLVYDLSGIKKDKNADFSGVVIDAKQDMKRGVAATLVIKSGTLKVADKIFAHGREAGKVRAIIDTFGKNIREATCGDAVEILGLSEVLPAGTVISTKQTGLQAKETIQPAIVKAPMDIREFLKAREQDFVPIVLKTETSAEMEAIKDSLPSKIKVIYEGQGDIAVSDVLLAKDFSALIIGFNVGIATDAKLLAESENVFNKSYRIIYELLDELNQLILAVNTKAQEKELGRGTILASFLGTSGPILGTKVISGRLAVGDRVKILRGEKVIGESSIASIKKGKEDVKIAAINNECGIMIKPEVDFAKGDAIIAYKSLQSS
jgi:translation initiation factor IF-2